MAIEAFVPPDAARVATVYTNAPKRLRRAVFADLCTLLCSHACPRRRNSVHKCPRTAPRDRFRRSVYTPLLPRLPTTAQPHKCPKTAPRGRFRRSVYTLCPHGRSCERVGPRVPQRRRPHGPRDAKALGPEAHAAGAAAHLRCQALLSPLVALECHRHGMRGMPNRGSSGGHLGWRASTLEVCKGGWWAHKRARDRRAQPKRAQPTACAWSWVRQDSLACRRPA